MTKTQCFQPAQKRSDAVTAHDRRSLTTGQRAAEYADALRAAGFRVCAVKINGREIEIVTDNGDTLNAPADLVDMTK